MSSSTGSGGGQGSAIVYAAPDSCERIARILRGHELRLDHTRGLEARSGRASRTISWPGRSRASSPRRRSAWGSTRRTSGSSASSTIPTRSRATCRWWCPAGTASRVADAVVEARPMTAVRRFAVSDIPQSEDLRQVYRAIRERGGVAEPEQRPRLPATAIAGADRVEQAGIGRRGFDSGRAMRVSCPSRRRRRRHAGRCSSVMRASQKRACSGSSPLPKPRVAVISRSPSISARRTQRRAALQCRDPRESSRPRSATEPLPGDVAGAITSASRGSSGIRRRSLVAMLRGSVAAPRSGPLALLRDPRRRDDRK